MIHFIYLNMTIIHIIEYILSFSFRMIYFVPVSITNKNNSYVYNLSKYKNVLNIHYNNVMSTNN